MRKFCCRTTGQIRMSPLATAILLALTLGACSDRGEGKPASQVAARVNKEEISVHQVNFLLQRTPNLSPDKATDAKRQILDGLVDQELAVQEALAAKLDRDPKVMQTLEAARREILARAYMDQAVAGKAKPSPEEVKAYYKEHPELFANRKIYRIQEIGFPASPEAVAAARDEFSKARQGEGLLNALRARGIKVAAGVMVKPAEKISLEILPRLARMKDGESALFEQGDRASIVTIIASENQPLTEEAARPAIEQFLGRRQSGELAKETIQHLRDKAHIEYVGEFSQQAEVSRKAREAKAAEETRLAQAARDNARLAQEAEASRQAEAMKKAREAADAARAKQSGRLPAAPDNTISKGISSLN